MNEENRKVFLDEKIQMRSNRKIEHELTRKLQRGVTNKR